MPSPRALALACIAVLTIIVLAAFGLGLQPRLPGLALAGLAAALGLAALVAFGLPGADQPRRGGGEAPGLFAQIRRRADARWRRQIWRFFGGGGGGTGARRRFGDTAVRLVLHGPEGDAKTLAALQRAWRAAAATKAPAASPAAKCEERGQRRLADLPRLESLAAVRAAAKGDPGFEYLDIGSAEGCITGALAADLGLPRDRAYACDVVPQASSDAFQFSLTDGRHISFGDGQFSLVTMFMSAHHFEDPTAMFAEAFRVSKPGAYLILREHGRTDPDSVLMYDLIHAYYEVVAGDETTPDEFARRYAEGRRPHYRDHGEWRALAEKAGFVFVEADGPRPDLYGTLYAAWRRP